jgi:hypothetical protein
MNCVPIEWTCVIDIVAFDELLNAVVQVHMYFFYCIISEIFTPSWRCTISDGICKNNNMAIFYLIQNYLSLSTNECIIMTYKWSGTVDLK